MLNKQLALTLIALTVCILFFEYTQIDVELQDLFYNFEKKRWIVDKKDSITRLIFYDGIKRVFYSFVILLVLTLIFFRNTLSVRKYKQGLLIVCLSCFLVPASIAILKATTNVPCPKNIIRYGGDYPYVTLLSKYPDSFHQTKKIKCYPAAHASGGFALMSLFFLFKRKKYKVIALISAISIGWMLGIYKMLIGDHFFSHTIVTMLLAWIEILIVRKITIVDKTNKLLST